MIDSYGDPDEKIKASHVSTSNAHSNRVRGLARCLAIVKRCKDMINRCRKTRIQSMIYSMRQIPMLVQFGIAGIRSYKILNRDFIEIPRDCNQE